MTNANESLRAELASLAGRLETLRVTAPDYSATVPTENRAEYDAVFARHRAIVAEMDAAEREARAAMTPHECFLAYACPKDSSDTFLADLSRLDSLSEEE